MIYIPKGEFYTLTRWCKKVKNILIYGSPEDFTLKNDLGPEINRIGEEGWARGSISLLQP